MQVNLSEIFSFDENKTATINAYNLYPYLLYAIDIYFITDDTVLYNYILMPILPEFYSNPDTTNLKDGYRYYNLTLSKIYTYVKETDLWSVNSDISYNSRIFLIIDEVTYPIKFGSPGESPTNPIVFKRTNQFSNISLTRSYGDPLELIGTSLDVTESDNEEVSNIGSIRRWETYPGSGIFSLTINPGNGEHFRDTSTDKVLGTNIDANDYVEIKFTVSNDIFLNEEKFGFGGAELNGIENDGFGGYALAADLGILEDKVVEGYGGVVPNLSLQKAVFVIQRSNYIDLDRINYNTNQTGYGAGGYGGIQTPNNGYGGVNIVDNIEEVESGIKY